ncbi:MULTISPECIES: hypothetical protein [unclassified Streptomyces]|uniref:hypothetical protein n=1 Tax=unclassified Streptomyces TaxID=2593676 RepID=UPI002035758D|nr:MULTISPECIES: hypothetical protein [unclassified Streptomyces]
MKRSLAALVLSGGVALALSPAIAHAGESANPGPPIAKRLGDIVDHPGHAVHDTKTAVGVTASAAGSAAKATDGSLSGTGSALTGGLPKTPKVG